MKNILKIKNSFHKVIIDGFIINGFNVVGVM